MMMTKLQKEWIDIVIDSLDQVLEQRQEKDFVEIVGRVGGDIVVRRVYQDGKVFIR